MEVLVDDRPAGGGDVKDEVSALTQRLESQAEDSQLQVSAMTQILKSQQKHVGACCSQFWRTSILRTRLGGGFGA